MTERDPQRRTYRFPALERRGIAGGLRPTQVMTLAGASLLAVLVVRRMPGAAGLGIGLLLLAAAAIVCWLPVAARGLDEWLPVIGGWAWLTLSGRRRVPSTAPTSGTIVDLETRRRRNPSAFADILPGYRLRAVPLASGEDLGVLEDRRAHTSTVLLAVRVRSFALLAADEQERRLLRWGRAVASLARTGTGVRRIQILERTLPHDEDQLRDWAASAADSDVPAGSDVRRSYHALLDGAADVTQDHDVVLALQLAHHRARAADLDGWLLREVRAFSEQLEAAEAGIVGALDARDCAKVIARAIDPFRRPELHAVTATETSWDHFRVDAALHRTFWVAQWPRLDVGPAFLGPLLLTVGAVRTISVVAEPVPPLRSRRAVEAALTSEAADEQLREERGFRTSARRRAQHEAAARREAELAEGHEEVRFAGFITVSARSVPELDKACDEVVKGAHQAYLDLQPMWGQQDTGFRCGALPVCEGLSPASLLDR